MQFSALIEDDFVLSAETITFSAGSTTRCIILTILADTLVESEEIFEIHLSAALGSELPRLLSVLDIVRVHITDITGKISTSNS